jgi:polyisoprenoid-binding protein YceI
MVFMALTIRSALHVATITACLTVWSGHLAANDALRVTTGEVSVMCPLTVGGSFEAKTKAVTGEVAVASGVEQPLKGELTVDLEKLQTGIGLRDRHMKENYLEVKKGQEFAEARLRDIKVDALSGKTSFRGVLMLHGEEREVSGTANIKPSGEGYRVEASFPVRISEFEIPDPTYLGVGVKDEVQVRVNFTVAPASGAAAAASR